MFPTTEKDQKHLSKMQAWYEDDVMISFGQSSRPNISFQIVVKPETLPEKLLNMDVTERQIQPLYII